MVQLTRRAALVLFGSAALFVPPAAAESAVPARAVPIDQGSRDPSFAAMRARLLAAVKARDAKAVIANSDPRIQLGFGGQNGIANFQRALRAEPTLWAELQWVLENGGRFEKDGSFSAPYTFTVDVGQLDSFEAAVVVGTGVVARAQPRADAPAVATIDRQVVKVVDWGKGNRVAPFYKRTDWLPIELPGKGKAFVEAKHLRASVDYRAGFVKKRGTWKMTFFLAGD